MVGEAEELVDRLGARVAPAALRGGTEDAVVFLGERDPVVLAVDLGARGEHDPGAVPRGGAEHDLGAHDVGGDGLHRALEDEPHADGGGQVIHEVGSATELLDQGLVRHRALDEAQPGVPEDGLEVLGPAGGEVVEHDHLVPLAEERLDEVRADEAGAARHQNPHRTLLTAARSALAPS